MGVAIGLVSLCLSLFTGRAKETEKNTQEFILTPIQIEG